MEKKMETTIMGLYRFKLQGLEFRVSGLGFWVKDSGFKSRV